MRTGAEIIYCRRCIRRVADSSHIFVASGRLCKIENLNSPKPSRWLVSEYQYRDDAPFAIWAKGDIIIGIPEIETGEGTLRCHPVPERDRLDILIPGRFRQLELLGIRVPSRLFIPPARYFRECGILMYPTLNRELPGDPQFVDDRVVTYPVPAIIVKNSDAVWGTVPEERAKEMSGLYGYSPVTYTISSGWDDPVMETVLLHLSRIAGIRSRDVLEQLQLITVAA